MKVRSPIVSKLHYSSRRRLRMSSASVVRSWLLNRCKNT